MGLTVRFLALLGILSTILLVDVEEASAADGWSVPDGPLRVRNLSPAMQLYGLPRMSGARVIDEGWEASFNIEIGNNFQSDLVDGTFGFFDGETYVNSYRLRRGIADNWEVGFELPWVLHAPGSLDGLVDEFHELFGLPDGERSLAPRGRLDYFISSQGTVYADFNNSQRDIGDARAFVGWNVVDDPGRAIAIRGAVKFPTGSVEKLSGSEGTDISLWGEMQQTIALSGRDIRLTLGGGFTHLGDGELIPRAQETWVHFGHLGLQIPINRRVEFHAQLDAHSRVLDTGNPLLADGGVLGTLGSRIGITEKFWLDLSIIEDLEAESASDVVFQILLSAYL